MRILQVNQYNYPRGGADKYFIDLSRSLEEAGHTVALFSMKHPKNTPSAYDKYFLSRVSFNEDLGFKNKLKIPGRVLYSCEAKRKFRKIIKDFKPEIIHIHNIYHHISPSILSVARKRKIPVVMHLHDYKLICPNHALFTGGKYCERCLGGKYGNCFKYRCIKGSVAGSFLGSVEMHLHHSILKIYEKDISYFIAPSRFMKDICVRAGQDEKKIDLIYNPYSRDILGTGGEPSVNTEKLTEPYLLYFGRLSEEKGLDTLIRASSASGFKVKIAGEGDREAQLKALAQEIGAPVEFLGFRSGQDLTDIIKAASAVVLPSIWAENMPLSLLEAMKLNKIAIVSDMGGLPEAVANEINGYIFSAGEFRELASRIIQLKDLSQAEREDMEKAAGDKAELFSPENNLEKVISLYKKALNY